MLVEDIVETSSRLGILTEGMEDDENRIKQEGFPRSRGPKRIWLRLVIKSK